MIKQEVVGTLFHFWFWKRKNFLRKQQNGWKPSNPHYLIQKKNHSAEWLNHMILLVMFPFWSTRRGLFY
ncbi:hypothetical protein ASU79_00745 [Klebsiella aerogenes]|nr:hypothetical protein YA15_09600 [Klebsiella aerogenes]KLE73237.1 hypothetical protein YA16_00255 [Klebsiella aerogenes]KLF14138.1 hypothetical protein YA26_13585 [Klebsiella aerogenes]KLF64232.1 hypothetical protein YA37_09540 [Klebsiella aerogenes]KTJ69211.1 hypothetical protein ASU79_00745 [Klebsiella aerogenes]